MRTFVGKVWNFGVNAVASALAVAIVIPLGYVVVQFWRIIFPEFFQ